MHNCKAMAKRFKIITDNIALLGKINLPLFKVTINNDFTVNWIFHFNKISA